ncbi:MAG TPA: hypothetical protein VF889_09610, partial [Bacteroidota bacterium]
MEALLFVLFCVAVIGGLLLIFKVTEFSRALQILEVEVKDLRHRLDALSASLQWEHSRAAPRTSAPVEETPRAAPSQAARLTEEMLAIEHQVETARGTTVLSGPSSASPSAPLEAKPLPPVEPPPPPAEPAKPSRTREEWEQLIG